MYAALLAATTGFIAGCASGASIYHFLLRPDLSFSAHLLIGIALGLVTSVIGFAVVLLFVRWRLASEMPAMGPLPGACLGVLVLALVTLVHAAVSPGASGWLVSFTGQFLAALVLVGWLALLLGVVLGRHINRVVT